MSAEGGDATRQPALSARHSLKGLRTLLRASPLIAPEVRAHWLRVLPHLTAEQRAELAALLEGEASGVPAADAAPADASPAAPAAAPGRLAR
jgi:hypothetical protein